MKKHTTRLILFLAIVSAIRLFIIQNLELSPDEAYYWDWSRHLQLSFYDHPPMVAVFIYLSTWLGGHSEFFVRLTAVLSVAGLSVIAYILGRDLYDSERAGYYSVLWLNVLPLVSLGAIVITPDTPQALFFVLTIYLLYRAIFKNQTRYWYFSGVSLGLALLSKYTAALLVPCLFIFLFFSYRYKPLLRKKEPYIFLALSGLVFSPVILWNSMHQWVSLKFQFRHGFDGKSINPLSNSLEFLGTQLGLATPFVFVGIGVVMLYCYRSWRERKDDRFIYLPALSVPIFVFFLVVSFKSKVEGNWPAMVYLLATIAMAGFYITQGGREKTSRVKWFYWLKQSAIITTVLVAVVVHVHTQFRIVPIPPKKDFLKRLHGWELLGQHAGKFLYSETGQANAFVFADRHQIVSELAFYIPGQPQTYQRHGLKRYPYLGNLRHLIGQDG
ncbi:MAG: ArnT family glycosyltransferase, partial [Nitrospinales bacterium]